MPGNANSGRTPDERDLHKITTRLTAEQIDQVTELTDQTEETWAETLRTVVTLGISKLERKLFRQ